MTRDYSVNSQIFRDSLEYNDHELRPLAFQVCMVSLAGLALQLPAHSRWTQDKKERWAQALSNVRHRIEEIWSAETGQETV